MYSSSSYKFTYGVKNPFILQLKQFFSSRNYLHLASPQMTQIADNWLFSAVKSYQIYHRLTICDGSFNTETYAKIGAEIPDNLLGMTLLHNPNLRRLLQKGPSLYIFLNSEPFTRDLLDSKTGAVIEKGPDFSKLEKIAQLKKVNLYIYKKLIFIFMIHIHQTNFIREVRFF